MTEKTHVVVTLYISPKNVMVVNVYGPYTWNRAKNERAKIKKEFPGASAFCRRTIDVDKMNEEMSKDEAVTATGAGTRVR